VAGVILPDRRKVSDRTGCVVSALAFLRTEDLIRQQRTGLDHRVYPRILFGGDVIQSRKRAGLSLAAIADALESASKDRAI